MAVEAFATVNLFSALGNSAYTWSNAYAGTDKAYVNDGKLDRRVVVGSPASNIELVIDMGTATNIKGMALLNHNCLTTLGAAVSVSVKGADDAAITTNPVTVKAATSLASYFSYSSREPRNKDHLLAWGGSTSKRYWQILWTYTGTIANFSIGEIFAYNAVTQLSRYSEYGSDDALEHTLTTEVETLSGDRRAAFLAGPIRRKRLHWTLMTSTQRDQLLKLSRDSIGNVGNVLWASNYVESSSAAAAAEQDCILGYLGNPDFASPENDYHLYDPNEIILTSRGREIGA